VTETPGPAAVATARRTVAQRIERLLAGLEQARRQPSRREVFHICDALTLMKGGQHAEAEAAVLRAEHANAVPVEFANRLDTNAPATVDQLRARLAQALAGAE
jgi:hypothetical protein